MIASQYYSLYTKTSSPRVGCIFAISLGLLPSKQQRSMREDLAVTTIMNPIYNYRNDTMISSQKKTRGSGSGPYHTIHCIQLYSTFIASIKGAILPLARLVIQWMCYRLYYYYYVRTSRIYQQNQPYSYTFDAFSDWLVDAEENKLWSRPSSQ